MITPMFEITEDADAAKVLDEVRLAYEAHAKAQAVAEERRVAERRLRQEREQEAIREWLATWMPQPLIQYVQIDEYDYGRADRWDSNGSAQGTWMDVRVPGATPVAFKMYRSGDDLGFGTWSYARQTGGASFKVPVMANMDWDEEGDLHIDYDWPSYPQYTDFNLALGHALSLYAEWWRPLQEQQRRMEALKAEADAQAEERPEVATGQTWQEKLAGAIVEAINEIAPHPF